MKILVVSDSHGHKSCISKAIELESPELIIHLGDNDKDCVIIEQEYPEIPFRTVRGNCDYASSNPGVDQFTLGDKQFLITHGDRYGVKSGLTTIISHASSKNIDVLLFGHTHKAHYSVVDNMTVVNPGSIGLPMPDQTYAVLDISDGVICELKKL